MKYRRRQAAALLFTGCDGEDAENQAAEEYPTKVKVVKVLVTDAPLTLSYSGQVVDRDKMKVQSKVSSFVVEKYVKGGKMLLKGKNYDRQYQVAVLQAEANLAKLKNSFS